MWDDEKLSKYILYFKKINREMTLEKNKKLPSFVLDRDPMYTAYEAELKEFVHYVETINFMDYNYNQTLETYHATTYTDMVKKIESAPVALLKATLSYLIRAERFTSGAWIAFVEDGTFLKVLQRIKTLNKP